MQSAAVGLSISLDKRLERTPCGLACAVNSEVRPAWLMPYPCLR